jgi:4-hydroxy 2-oxovalerate aldolase
MVNVLDCTLRDGGYYNDWDFSDSFVQKYLEVSSLSGISHVEIGFRFFKNQSHSGPWAYSPDEKLQDFEIPKNLKLGVMVNAQEFELGQINQQTSQLFNSETSLNFVRVAFRFEELDKAREIIPAIQQLGLSVGINLMQVSELESSQIQFFSEIAATSKADFAYAADSLGALNPIKTQEITRLFVSESDIPFGLHAHDNNGLALSNSVSAMESGAKMIDSTMAGMGRGAGNTSTEELLLELVSRSQHKLSDQSLRALNSFLDTYMNPMKMEFRWGSSLAYNLAANWGIHPSFVQELVEEGQGGERLVTSLINLRGLDATRFNRELLTLPSESPELKESKHFATNQFLATENSPVLIIGGGDSAKVHSKEIFRFASRENLTSFLLNLALKEQIPESGSNLFRLAANVSRLDARGFDFWGSPEEKIVPYSPENAASKSGTTLIPLKYAENQIDFLDGIAQVPNDLTISYALAVAAGRKPKVVYLAGVDGYGEGSVRNSELNRTLALFRQCHPSIEVLSLTPTTMPIPIRSPYWRG